MRCLKPGLSRLGRRPFKRKSAGTISPRRFSQPLERVACEALVGLALEVRDLVGLGVGLLLRATELLLGVALALLLLALAAQARVVGEVAGGLLRAPGDLVHDSHDLPP